MKDLAIVIFSCDKNEELWPVDYHCIEKYWKNHPNLYLLTETKECPFIKTISLNYDLDNWTKRIRESLEQIEEEYIIFICDDCFLNNDVNIDKLNKCLEIIKTPNTANINFELLDDDKDKECPYEGFKKKDYGSKYILSLLCGMWNKKILIELLSLKDCNPWIIEKNRNHKYYEYYQNCGEKILSWFRDGKDENAAIRQGKWMHGVEDFAKEENITIDFSKKGFWSYGYWEKYNELLNKINEEVKILNKYQAEFDKLVEEEKNKTNLC